MNKIYCVVFNRVLGRFVVASELARSNKKSSGNQIGTSRRRSRLHAVAAGAMLVASVHAQAQTVSLPVWDPTVNDNQVGTITAANGNTVTITGSATQIKPGITGAGSVSLATLLASGQIVSGAQYADPNNPASLVVNTGPLNQTLVVPDPITGGTRTVTVYSDANISDTFATSVNSAYIVVTNTAVNGQQYINTRIGAVASTGGTLNVNIGTAGAATNAINNYVKMGAAKQSYLFAADGTGSANSTVVWQSNNMVDMGSVTAALLSSGGTSATTQAFSTYKGTFTAFDGSSHTVNNASDLQGYNNWLIAQLQSGVLNPGQYTSQFNLAYTNTNQTITYSNGPANMADEAYQPIGNRAVIYANGAKGAGVVAAGAMLDGMASYDSRSGAPAGSAGAVMLADNGATITNNGTVSSARGGSDSLATMEVRLGAHAVNNGVVNAGYYAGFAGAVDPLNPTPQTYALGMFGTGAGSTVSNTGIINSAGAAGIAMALTSGAQGTNSGIINVDVTAIAPTSTYAGTATDGITLNTGSSFTNTPTGLIYLGRQPQYNVAAPESVADIASNITPLYGILVQGSAASTVTNQGTITLGTLVQGSVGIESTSTSSATRVTNAGTININGNASATPAVNIGMLAVTGTPANTLSNSGVININGVNAIGEQAQGGGQISSSGTINVLGGADPATGLRNYGMWVQDAGSIGTLTGTLNLAGNGAIGAHARLGGTINVAGAGAVNFVSGSDQIGYYVYGAGSAINNTGVAAQNVSTAGSTLYRMEAGASFTGGSGASSSLTASGDNSTAVQVTSATGNTVSAFNSGGMSINVTGQNATAVRVEGGAQGKIASNATINLSGAGAVAGIADGQYYGLTGAASGAPIAGTLLNASLNAGAAGFGTGTVLVSGATLNSSLDDVTGFIARNAASLSNSGNIVFTGADTTGIEVDAGATGGNSGNITVQDGSVGLSANSTGASTTLNNTGNLIVKGGSDADRTTGISATGSGVTVNMTAGTLNLQGQGAVGVQASSGANVVLAGTALPQFAADGSGVTDQIAFQLVGAGSTIVTNIPNGTVLDSSGTSSTLFRLDDGANLAGVLQVRTSGTDARGIAASGAGTTATVLAGSAFNLIGEGSQGVYADGGANVTINAGSNFTLAGNGAVAGVVNGDQVALDGSITASNTGTQLTNLANLTSTASGATGFIAENLGTLTNLGNITMTGGTGNTGVQVLNGQLVNSGNIVVNGTAVYVTGANAVIDNQGGDIQASDGKAAIELGASASLDLMGSGLATITGKGTADGVLVDAGAVGLKVQGATINVNDASSTGNGIENAAELAGIQLNNTTINTTDGAGVRTAATLDANNSGTINVGGAGQGIAFEQAGGGASSNNLDLSASQGLTINVNGANGVGILANTTGTVDTAATVNVTNAAGGAALALNGVSTASNSGNLISQSTTAPVVATGSANNFTNSGTIEAVNAAAVAANFDGQNTTFLNTATGKIIGAIGVGEGNNTFTNNGSMTGALSGGDGNNTIRLNAGSTLTGDTTLGNGANLVAINAGVQQGSVYLGSGSNTLTINNGGQLLDNPNAPGTGGNVVAGNAGSAGSNIINVGDANSAGTISGAVTLGGGSDALTVNNGSRVGGTVNLGDGSNTFTAIGSASVADVLGGAGDDVFTIKGQGGATPTFTSLNGGMGAGTDSLIFDNANYTLSRSAAIANFESLILQNASTLTLNSALLMSDGGTDQGVVTVKDTSTLAVQMPGAFALDNKLASAPGEGLVTVDTAGQAFDFTSNVGSQFQGKVELGNSQFALGGVNTTALTHATLQLDAGNTTTVTDGTQNIGGFTFNGGTAVFDAMAPAQSVANSLIASGKLDVSGVGTVQIQVPAAPGLANPITQPGLSLLAQDDVNVGVQLIQASGAVTGTAGAIKVVDQNGHTLTDNGQETDQQIDIAQNGTTVATGTYGYRVTTGANNDGLYVNYGLKLIDVFANQMLVLAETPGATGVADDLSAQVTGAGGLDIESANSLSISNVNNDYQGATSVGSGTLVLGTDHALGNTSGLSLDAGTTVDVNGKTQTVGTLDTADGSTLDLNQGALTVAIGGSVAGNSLNGAGTFNLTGGTLAVNGPNANFSAATSIASGATAVLFDAAGLGSATIADAGTLTFDGDPGTAINAISGAGAVTLVDDANIRLTGDNSAFNGNFDIATGSTLTVSQAKNLGTAVIADAGTLQLDGYNDNLANTLSGIGAVSLIDAANVTLTADNSAFAGTFNIANGSMLSASQAQNLGTAAITDNGVLNINTTTDWTFSSAVTGSGDFIKDGSGTLTLGTSLGYQGSTAVNAGTLIVGDETAPNVALGANGAAAVTVAAGATLAGQGVVNGTVTNNGTLAALNALSDHAGTASSNFTLAGGLNNAGLINLANAQGSIGNSLTVKGDYAGANGSLALNTQLNEGGPLSNQVTDRLLIGGNASGQTLVTVNGFGNGALTDVNQTGAMGAENGISLIQVAGQSSASTFQLAGGYVAVGPWRYELQAFAPGSSAADQRVVAGSGNGFWDYRLGNVYVCQTDCTPDTPSPPTPPTPPAPPTPSRPEVVPQVPSYLVTPLAMFGYGNEVTGSLHERLGEVRQDQLVDPSNDYVEMFARYIGGSYDYKSSLGFQNYGYNYSQQNNALQIGGNWLRAQTDHSEWRLGAAVTTGHSSVTPNAVDGVSSLSFDSTSIAGTVTWQRNDGLYVDGVVSKDYYYSGNVSTVDGGKDVAKPKAQGWSASIESGYPVVFANDPSMTFEPEVQLSYQSLGFKGFTDKDGLTVHTNSADQFTARMGARLTKTFTDTTSGRLLTPYVKLDVVMSNGGNPDVTVGSNAFDVSNSFATGKLGSALEAGGGITGRLSNKVSIYGEVSYRSPLDSSGLSGVQGNVGVRVAF